MTRLRRGLHEALITEGIERELAALPTSLLAHRTALHPAEAADRIALHLSRIVERTLASLDEKHRVGAGVALARRLVELLQTEGAPGGARRAELLDDRPIAGKEHLLRAILGKTPDGEAEVLAAPQIPLLDSALLTNAPGEPNLSHQLDSEIASADRIDVIMAFVRRTGVRPLASALRRHCDEGRELRVLTTVYTGSTEAAALDDLRKLGAEVRVSYDTSTTRLHAKAWLFHRESSYSTAYVGSSNLTHSAQVTGLEWNLRVSGARTPSVIEKIAAVFESYWSSGDFVDFELSEFEERTKTSSSTKGVFLSPIELRPEPFQERMLEQIELARDQGHHRNLLVSATGTGKTVMAAIDYARLRTKLPRARLLFVAHRAEILAQAQATFAHALRDPSFGELWVGGERPKRFAHVFASIQSLDASGLEHLDPSHFDVVIVDEFHHAAAPSYERLLSRVSPRELLGLTATPERADGLPILHWFDDRIAAELRLWDAIEQQRLVPFAYYGIHDGLDLRDVAWTRGRGYDVEGLTNVYTRSDFLARKVLQELRDHAEDLSSVRALGFCVSVEHARYMARVFNDAGIAAKAVWGETKQEERDAVLAELRDGELRVLFSVDLFNEGVDLPSVDTLLLLRPTDSPTLYLQQLGRGLRKAPGKRLCTVLDFIGQHRREFRIERRFAALLGGTRREIEQQVGQGFPFLPAGCQLQLDRKASEIVLANLRDAIPSQWAAKVELLRTMSARGGTPSMESFLDESGLALDDLYEYNRGWSELLEAAGLSTEPAGPLEPVMRRALGRLLHIDDTSRIEHYLGWLSRGAPPPESSLSARERRLLRMLVASLHGREGQKESTLDEGASLVWAHPQVRAELRELLTQLLVRRSHLTKKSWVTTEAMSRSLAEVPLELHARYSRIEILAACGVGAGPKVASWQQGVRWLPAIQSDLFAFTLDKTEGHFSPTTRYRDYAISPELIHWESQSITRADSETGRRYQEHAARGSHVLLFARLRQSDRAFSFLGPARYVSHESEQPMRITWRLEHRLPADLFAAYAAAVA